MKTIARRVLTYAAVWLAAPAFAQSSIQVPGLETDRQSHAAVSHTGNAALDEQSRDAENDRGPERSPRRRDALEEVIVTAQRREERLQDVPISISVLTSDALDRSTEQGLADLLRTVPGVTTLKGNLGGQTTIMMRGVAASSVFGGGSMAGFYLDSAPFGFVRQGFAPDTDVYDLERVEVLRGPQGTLYGASSANGVIRLLTKDADPQKFDSKIRVAVSGTDKGGENYRGDLMLNVPLIEDKLAGRAVVGYQDWSGWIDKPNDKDVNDAQIKNYRLKLNGRPSEDLSVGLAAWSYRGDFGAPSDSAGGGRRLYQDYQFDEAYSNQYDLYALTLNYNFPAFFVRSATSYLDYNNGGRLDRGPIGSPGTYLVSIFESEVFAQEIYVSSTSGGAWRWTAGTMYRNGDDRLYQNMSPGNTFVLDFGQSSESIAFFGELTRLFANGRFSLTAGMRYFEDDVGDMENSITTGASPPLITREDTFDATTPRVVLTWHPNDDLSVYGSYSEGFRSGFNQWALITRQFPEFPSVQPDTIENYELGGKGNFLNGRITFDTALYFVQWQDRIAGLLVNHNGVLVSTFVNGGSASGMGVDLGLTAQLTDRFGVGATFNWNDLTMDADVLIRSARLFAEGDRLPTSPEYLAGFSAQYEFPLGENGARARFSVAANYISELENRRLGVGGVIVDKTDTFLFGHADLSVQMPNNMTATLFVDNLANEYGAMGRDSRSVDWTARPRPRTVGLQFEYHY